MVLDPESDFKCINEFATDSQILNDSLTRASLIENNYSKNEISTNEDYRIKRGYELFKVFLSKLKRLDKKYTSKIVNMEYNNIVDKMVTKYPIFKGLPEKGHHSGPCVPGTLRLFVNADGKFYPCERVSEDSEVMYIGNIEDGFYIDKVRSLLNVGKLTEKNCKECWAFNSCNLCAAYADDLTSLNPNKKASMCNSQRYYTEDILKNYCSLKEFGDDFIDEDDVYINENELEVQL